MMQFVFASLLRFVDVRKFHEHSLSKNGTLQLNASKIYEESKWKEVKYANLFCIVSYYIYQILRYAYAKSYCTFILIKCIELIILQVFFRSMVCPVFSDLWCGVPTAQKDTGRRKGRNGYNFLEWSTIKKKRFF